MSMYCDFNTFGSVCAAVVYPKSWYVVWSLWLHIQDKFDACSSVYADVVIGRAGMLLALLWTHILKEQKLIVILICRVIKISLPLDNLDVEFLKKTKIKIKINDLLSDIRAADLVCANVVTVYLSARIFRDTRSVRAVRDTIRAICISNGV